MGRRLYLIQMGIWIWTALSHRFLEARHKDYFIMYAHHIITLLLVAGSYHLEYNRIGVLVLLLHDASDIVIDLMKMFNIIGLDEKSGTYLAESFYVISMLIWPYFRFHGLIQKVIFTTMTHAARTGPHMNPNIVPLTSE